MPERRPGREQVQRAVGLPARILAPRHLARLLVQVRPGDVMVLTDLRPPQPAEKAFRLVRARDAVAVSEGAAPMILLYAGIARRRRTQGGAVAATGFFALGYVVVWGAFSIGAVMLQYLLAQAALISPMMRTTSAVLAGLLLIGAGIWQWTPLKDACLRHCRSPLNFVLNFWRDGARGAFIMGLRHGGYCLGCCWMLMLLLFVGGVMNLLWIAGLALYVLLEKVVPAGRWLGRVAGLLLVAWGAGGLSGVV